MTDPNFDPDFNPFARLEKESNTPLHKYVEEIDAEFWNGYADEHPELLAAYVQAAAIRDAAKAIENMSNAVSGSIDEQDWVSAALHKIAEAIERAKED